MSVSTLVTAAAKLFAESFKHPNTDKNVVFYDHSVEVLPADQDPRRPAA